MTCNTNVLKTAVAVALVSLMGAGCFWLEPIAPYNPDPSEPGDGNPDLPDGGNNPDGGGLPDGGGNPDSGVNPAECGPETPVPAGASVDIPGDARAWMYLDPGDTLIPGGGGLRLLLNGTYDQKVPVEIRPASTDVIEPESDWICIPPGETEMEVGLQALAVGNTELEARVGGAVVDALHVTVVSGPPTFSLVPGHGYFNPGQIGIVGVQLSHPSLVPVTLNVLVPGIGEPYESFTLAVGEMEMDYEFEFPDVPLVEVEVSSPELNQTVTTDFRRAVNRVLISEVLLDSSNGFVELYNPTGETISLENQQLVIQVDSSDFRVLANFALGQGVAAHSFFLVGWGDYQDHAHLQVSPTNDLDTAYRLFLGSRQNDRGMSSVIDALLYSRGWNYVGQSLERQAWPDASATDMQDGGQYETAGNAHDSDDSNSPSTPERDFVLRSSPGPQGVGNNSAEHFFLP